MIARFVLTASTADDTDLEVMASQLSTLLVAEVEGAVDGLTAESIVSVVAVDTTVAPPA